MRRTRTDLKGSVRRVCGRRPGQPCCALPVYEGLEVPEVWIWEEGRVKVFGRGEKGYEPRERSAFLPDLDLALLATLAERPSQTQAARELRDRLRGGQNG